MRRVAEARVHVVDFPPAVQEETSAGEGDDGQRDLCHDEAAS